MAAFEEAGGALLDAEAPANLAEDALDRALASIAEATVPQRPPQPNEACPLPVPVLNAIGRSFDDIQWRFQLPGVSVFDLDGFGDEQVSLMRAKPGARLPRHTHEGFEMTLVLQGALKDDGEEFRVGDVSMNDETHDHRPEILGPDLCYCLIVQSGRLRFTGTLSRALNYFVR